MLMHFIILPGILCDDSAIAERLKHTGWFIFASGVIITIVEEFLNKRLKIVSIFYRPSEDKDLNAEAIRSSCLAAILPL